jgi:MFS transporter, ACS family, aldohexuronate transporter
MASIGKYAWIPFLIAGIGNILGGWLSAVMLRHHVSLTVARKGSVTVFAILMACAIPAVLVHSALLSFVLVSSAMLGYTGVTANMLAFPADVFPGNVVASIWGLAGLGSGFGGMVFALITGWLVDHYSYLPVFMLAGLMPFIAVAIIWFIIGPLRAGSESVTA